MQQSIIIKISQIGGVYLIIVSINSIEEILSLPEPLLGTLSVEIFLYKKGWKIFFRWEEKFLGGCCIFSSNVETGVKNRKCSSFTGVKSEVEDESDVKEEGGNEEGVEDEVEVKEEVEVEGGNGNDGGNEVEDGNEGGNEVEVEVEVEVEDGNEVEVKRVIGVNNGGGDSITWEGTKLLGKGKVEKGWNGDSTESFPEGSNISPFSTWPV